MSLPFGAIEALVALAVVVLGAAVQAGVGFGLALIAAPVLLLLHGPLVPGPLMAASLVLTLLVAHRDRASMDLSGIAWALTGRVVGTAGAAVFLALASAALFDLVFGALVLLAVALSLLGLHVPPGRASAAGAGALSGLMGTISSIGGPPMALLYQREGASRLRGTLAGFFVLGAFLSLGALVAVGRFGRVELELAAFLAPAMAIGFAVAEPLRRRLTESMIRPLVLGLSSLSGGVVLWKALWQALWQAP